MNRHHIIAWFLILAGILLWWFWPASSTHPEFPASTTDGGAGQAQSAAVTEESTAEQSVSNQLINSKPPTEVAIRESENQEFPYHPDPLVDMIMGMLNHGLCLIKEDEDKKSRLEALSDSQQTFLQPHLDACDEPDSLHSQYTQAQMMNRFKLAFNRYGEDHLYLKMLNQRFSPISDDLQRQALAALRDMRGSELLIASALMTPYFDQVVLPQIQTTLGGSNTNISKLVMEQALYVIACDSGANCSANSGIMLSRCVEHETACGLDHNTYINSHYMQGMMNEISLATRLLKKHFGWP